MTHRYYMTDPHFEGHTKFFFFFFFIDGAINSAAMLNLLELRYKVSEFHEQMTVLP